MKLKEGFITHQANGEHILIDAGANNFAGLVRSNPTAAFIIDCLKEETSSEEILKKMYEKYDGNKEKMKQDIDMIISKLHSIGALYE